MNTHSGLASATLTVPEAGEALGLSRSTAYRLARSGEFPVRVLELGRTLRIPRAEFERYLGITDGSVEKASA